jgi:integrase
MAVPLYSLPPKHLPRRLWPTDDKRRLDAAFAPGDIFDDNAPPGAHLSAGTRLHIETAYRRWLGFLSQLHPADLALAAEDRITPKRIRDFVELLHLEVRDTTIASILGGVHAAARLVSPALDWSWLASVKRRVHARSIPLDRLEQLQAPWETYDLGSSLMEEARKKSFDPHFVQDVAFRDGLLLAMSFWPIRRRSIAALTIDRHLVRRHDAIILKLFAEDTKSGRPDTFQVPAALVAHFAYYLDMVRPRLVRFQPHNALWASARGSPLTGDGIYQVVRYYTGERFGKRMGLHDMRRSAATFLALEAPEKVGLIAPLLQHTNADISERHYNLAGMARASSRYLRAIAASRARGFSRGQRG